MHPHSWQTVICKVLIWCLHTNIFLHVYGHIVLSVLATFNDMVDWMQNSALFAHTHASGALAWERTYSPSICLRIVDMPQPNPARCHVLPPFVTWHLLALGRSRQSCLHSSCWMSRCSATMLAQHLPNQQVYGNHACTDRSKSARCLRSCTTPAESAGESQPCVALHLLNQVFGNHACTTPAEPSGVGDELYGLLDA